MLPTLLFSLSAALLVWLVGRRDPARDPELTTLVLALLALFPGLLALPKLAVLPAISGPLAVARGASSMWPVLVGVWLAGAVVFLARLMVGAMMLGRWRRRAASLGCVVGGIELLLLDSLRGPVAAGVFRRVVLLPPAWRGWDDETRRVVLAHELAHHARRDPLRRWIAAVACGIHWFNPLVWWLARRLHAQCEYACDVRVLDSGIAAKRYASLLCDLAETAAVPHPALAMAERASLESRVRRLLGGRRPCRRLVIALFLLSVTVLALGLALLKPAEQSRHPRSSTNEVQLRLTANPFPAD